MSRHYTRSKYRKRQRYPHRITGYERALQHIREAEKLSKELGGTDEDVKQYFFSLPPNKLQAILKDYGIQYGKSKRDYAEETLPLWRTGKRKMSGLVASRLFNLLPPRMPLEVKYELTKRLWEQYSPISHRILRIGPNSSEQDIMNKVEEHLVHTIAHYSIPQPLEQRFKWLSMGDVQVQQQLLNHLLDVETLQAIELIQQQVPILLNHIQNQGKYTQRLSQSIEIGKHKFDIVFDKNSSDTKIEAPQRFASTSHSRVNRWFWFWLVAGVFLLLWILIKN